MWLIALLACPCVPDTDETDTAPAVETDPPAEGTQDVRVEVRLDGARIAGVVVRQPGTAGRWRTGPDGAVEVRLDRAVAGGEVWVTASHPEARIDGRPVRRGDT